VINLQPPAYAPSGGTYHAIYPRDIWIYGTSLATTIDTATVGLEASMHAHAPLDGAPASVFNIGGFSVGSLGDANGNPQYPVGNWMSAMANLFYDTPPLPLDPGGASVTGEVEYVHLLRVTRNPELLAPGRSSSASTFDISVSPTYFEVLPYLQLAFPVSILYNLAGNSEVDGTMNHGTGNYAIGVTATWHTVWTASLNYEAYFGSKPNGTTTTEIQPNIDRDLLLFNLQRTF
jgi:hypothetical protein